ncbi:MAG: glycoside hydrolase family 172 protein [Acidimicrobiia bacterium]
MADVTDPSYIDPSLDARAATFENPTGARGAGGSAHGGRKGAPSRLVAAGETVTLLDTDGPGTIRHLWCTIPPAPPERMRACALDVFYDGAGEPSISVPVLDFCGAVHGRPEPVDAELIAVAEGRGFNSWVPVPFGRSVRVTFTNHGPAPTMLYYQLDFTLEPGRTDPTSFLHAAFRRENPTTMGRDFVISDGLVGPGRFLGCVVGVRTLDEGLWYGEGEVKVYRDGDAARPTICGTGLEDYVGTAWGMARHVGAHAGVPLDRHAPLPGGGRAATPDFVGFYRFHRLDPIMFTSTLRVTIQQIGFALFGAGQEADFERFVRTHPAAGSGWAHPGRGVHASGIHERVDDYCAVDLVYCRSPQPVAPFDVALATADLARLPYESADPMEAALAGIGGVASTG